LSEDRCGGTKGIKIFFEIPQNKKAKTPSSFAAQRVHVSFDWKKWNPKPEHFSK